MCIDTDQEINECGTNKYQNRNFAKYSTSFSEKKIYIN